MPAKRYVVMAAIPGAPVRPPAVRADLSYVEYARATWTWWCRRHGVDLVVLDRPEDDLTGAPPMLHRWRAAQRLLDTGPGDCQVAVVDADTMVRWDTPDFFALAGGALAGVQDPGRDWVYRSIRAYQPFFPGVTLDWWEYINSGLVVFAGKQAGVPAALLDFYRRHRAELDEVRRRSDAGIDQTLLNFVIRQAGEPVRFLPPPYNLGHCMPATLFALPDPDSPAATRQRRLMLDAIIAAPETFDFIRYAYVWHFNGPISVRTAFMHETWQRVRENYR
jgi:hypothetical protein